MAIKILCPRCKTQLHVPDGLSGKYGKCPRCEKRVLIPQDTTTQTDPAPQGDDQSDPVVPSGASRSKKVARFVTAEATESTLQLAADGKLPELQLEESKAKPKQERNTPSVNPLVLLAVLSLSVVLSIALVLIDVQSPPVSSIGQKDDMRQFIQDNYFGYGNLDVKRLETYQILLREAQQAYSRGDYKTQRANYRKVLDMLRAERGNEEKGLTGSRSRDKKLEEAISVLLSGG